MNIKIYETNDMNLLNVMVDNCNLQGYEIIDIKETDLGNIATLVCSNCGEIFYVPQCRLLDKNLHTCEEFELEEYIKYNNKESVLNTLNERNKKNPSYVAIDIDLENKMVTIVNIETNEERTIKTYTFLNSFIKDEIDNNDEVVLTEEELNRNREITAKLEIYERNYVNNAKKAFDAYEPPTSKKRCKEKIQVPKTESEILGFIYNPHGGIVYVVKYIEYKLNHRTLRINKKEMIRVLKERDFIQYRKNNGIYGLYISRNDLEHEKCFIDIRKEIQNFKVETNINGHYLVEVDNELNAVIYNQVLREYNYIFILDYISKPERYSPRYISPEDSVLIYNGVVHVDGKLKKRYSCNCCHKEFLYPYKPGIIKDRCDVCSTKVSKKFRKEIIELSIPTSTLIQFLNIVR